jgi:hypothetical protein
MELNSLISPSQERGAGFLEKRGPGNPARFNDLVFKYPERVSPKE